MEKKQVEDLGATVDQDYAQTLLLVFHGGAILVAVIFIALAFFVEQYPIPVTAVALTLFVVEQIVFAVIDPLNLARGWLIKIIVIAALVKALQAGIAAQKEERAAADADFGA